MHLDQRATAQRGIGGRSGVERITSFIDRLSAISGAIAGIGVIVLIFLVTNDVVMRYVFNRPTTWGLEISEYLLLYITLLSLSYTLLVDRHVRVDLVVTSFSEKTQRWLRLFGFVVCLLFGLILCWRTGETTVAVYQEGWRSSSQLMLPLFPVYVIMPLGFALFSLECLCKIYLCCRSLFRSGRR